MDSELHLLLGPYKLASQLKKRIGRAVLIITVASIHFSGSTFSAVGAESVAISNSLSVKPVEANSNSPGGVQLAANSPVGAQLAAASAQSAAREKIAKLTPSARQLAEQLKLVEPIDEVIAKQAEYDRSKNPQALIEAMAARQKLLMLLQHAALEVEEALAGIDGDLTINNMLLSYVTSKKERSNNLNNIATFIGSGTFGMADSGTSIKMSPPVPQIFGLVSSAIAVGLPMLALRGGSYRNPRKEATEANTLSPIFGRPYQGATYDPIVWNYIESVPPDGTSNETRRQLLLQRWQAYRGVRTTRGGNDKEFLDSLVGGPTKSNKLSLDVLKTRAELLFDVRALVQLMYKDISEISSMVVEL